MRWLSRRTDADSRSAARRGPKRARVAPWWRARAVRVSAAAGLAVTVGLLLLGAWQARLPHRLVAEAGQAVIAATVEMGLRVDDVLVVGRRETSRDELRQALGVGRGTPILFVDLAAARSRVMALPWVAGAAVERQLPDRLVVRVIERRPLAIWQNQGRFALIDADGAVIQREDLGRFADLLVVVGEGAPARAADLIAILETQPPLKQRVTAAVRVSDRRWNIRLGDGVDVLLPEIDPEAAWARLADYHNRHGILDRPVRIVDLRNPASLTVRPVLEAAPEDEAAAPGRET